MGFFECSRCGHFRNSDDGCSENPFGDGDICADCAAELDYQFDIAEEERNERQDT